MRRINKHVIITGGSSGIGLATARRLVQRGASVSLIARRREPLADAAESLRHLVKYPDQRIEIATADVARHHEIQQAIGDICRRSGPCDMLFACAGRAVVQPFEQLAASDFREAMDVNYFGTLYAIQAVVPGMIARRSGSLIAMATAQALPGVYGYSAYAPAKLAVRGLMDTLRTELKPYNISASIVYPRATATPLLAAIEAQRPEEAAPSADQAPLSADHVAKAMVRGVLKRQFLIVADTRSALLLRASELLAPVLQRRLDRMVIRARRKRRPEA